MTRSRNYLSTIFILTLLASAGCSDDFSPYNELQSLRVLTIRATPSVVAPGTTTTLDALVYEPSGTAPLYSWSWCPLRAGADDNYRCAISVDELRQLFGTLGFDGTSITYDLGAEPTAVFAHFVDPSAWVAFCNATGAVAGQVTELDCSHGLAVSIELTVKTATQQVTAIKDIILAASDDTPLNTNPAISGLSIAREDGTRADAIALSPTEPSDNVHLDESYELFADVPEESAEWYQKSPPEGGPAVPQREILTATWFIDSGSTDHTNTTFYEGYVPFTTLVHNTWTLPKPEEFHRSTARVFVVLKDNRGGVSFLAREINIDTEARGSAQ